MKKFSIEITCDKVKSSASLVKIKEYIEDFFINELLTKKGIAVNSKLDTLLQVNLTLNKEETYITSLPPYVSQKDNARIYPVLIAIGDRMDKPNPNLEFALILFDIVTEFLLINFKKVNKPELKALREHLDVQYINAMLQAIRVKDAPNEDNARIPA